MASFNGVVYMAWKGAVSDINVSSLWKGTWSPCAKIPGIGTQAAPALTWCVTELYPNGLIYLVWLGEHDNTIYWSYSGNGADFQPEMVVPGAASTDTPAIANFQGVIYLLWKGESDNSIWGAQYQPGAVGSPGWLYPGEFSTGNGMLTSLGPAVAYDNSGNLYLVWKGQSDNTIWASNNTQGEYQGNISMSPQKIIPVVLTDERPALASQGSNNTDILLAWKGATTNTLWVGPLQGLRG